jgi:hypothetical protein
MKQAPLSAYSAMSMMIRCQIEDQKILERLVSREEVETRKIGRNETWTFQGLFPSRCTEVDEKPGKKHDIIVSFLMKRAWMAE